MPNAARVSRLVRRQFWTCKAPNAVRKDGLLLQLLLCRGRTRTKGSPVSSAEPQKDTAHPKPDVPVITEREATTGTKVSIPPVAHAAGHTFDHASRKWDSFNAEAALAEITNDIPAPPFAAPPAEQKENGLMSAVHTIRKASPWRPLPPVRKPVAPAPPPDITAEGAKEQGNLLFKQGQHQHAVAAYTR